MMEMQKVGTVREGSVETVKTGTDVAIFGSDASKATEIKIQSQEKVGFKVCDVLNVLVSLQMSIEWTNTRLLRDYW